MPTPVVGGCGRAERRLNDTEMVRRKSPALQPPAPPAMLSGASLLVVPFPSPRLGWSVSYTQRECFVEGAICPPLLSGGAEAGWPSLGVPGVHRHMDNNLTVRGRREEKATTSRVGNTLHGVSLTEHILSERAYAWLPSTGGASAPRHRLKKIYARYVLQTFSTAKPAQTFNREFELHLIPLKRDAPRMSLAGRSHERCRCSGRTILSAQFVYGHSNSPRSAQKFPRTLEKPDRTVPPAAPFVALLLVSAQMHCAVSDGICASGCPCLSLEWYADAPYRAADAFLRG